MLFDTAYGVGFADGDCWFLLGRVWLLIMKIDIAAACWCWRWVCPKWLGVVVVEEDWFCCWLFILMFSLSCNTYHYRKLMTVMAGHRWSVTVDGVWEVMLSMLCGCRCCCLELFHLAIFKPLLFLLDFVHFGAAVLVMISAGGVVCGNAGGFSYGTSHGLHCACRRFRYNPFSLWSSFRVCRLVRFFPCLCQYVSRKCWWICSAG